jgi:hypothetical protein
MIVLPSNHQFMKNINPQTPIWKLTVEEFLEIFKKLTSESKYEYGLKGLQKFSVALFLKPLK